MELLHRYAEKSHEQYIPIVTHCYGRSLNLAANDVIKKSKVMKSALATTHEVTKLIKYSPHRDSLFQSLKSELSPDTPGIRVLCPTRWTVRANSLASVLSNYTVLQELWNDLGDIIKDTETIARINGVASQKKTFNFYFGVVLQKLILSYTDNLSSMLQHKEFSASEGQEAAKLTIKTLESIRNDTSFDLFWEKLERDKGSYKVSDPVVPRKRKAPQQYEIGSAMDDQPAIPKVLYRQQYYEALDLIINCVRSWFDQPNYNMYKNQQELLFNAIKDDDFKSELQYVSQFYKDDINPANLQIQLQVLAQDYPKEGPPVYLILEIT